MKQHVRKFYITQHGFLTMNDCIDMIHQTKSQSNINRV